jgi:leucyl-tRNA synthetase
MVPHVTAEAWERRHGGHVHEQPWPTADPALAAEERVMMVVQVNGKVRDRFEVPSSASEDELVERALASERVRAHLDGKEIRKRIVVPHKLVNLVV